MAKNTNSGSGSYTPSHSWCRGCGDYVGFNSCKKDDAVAYGHRLGSTAPTIPCWLVRGTVYCHRDESGVIK